MIKFIRNLTILFFWMMSISLYGQQILDSSFVGKVFNPAYEQSKGPKILIDQAHNNGATLQPSFTVLSNILKEDGYNLSINSNELSIEEIRQFDVLVIVDPVAEENIDNWELPTPSAFKNSEIDAINHFVKEGGSLFLVADHMPFSGASQKLAQSFGVNFINGFAIDTLQWDLIKFNRDTNSLKQHPIIDGRNYSEAIFEIGSYYGQCFTISNFEFTPILVFNDDNVVSYQPQRAWRFDSETQTIPAKGLYQGVAGEYGKGRIVILGDSSLVGAYLIGKNARPIGLNSIEVKDNFQFILNIVHWLSRLY